MNRFINFGNMNFRNMSGYIALFCIGLVLRLVAFGFDMPFRSDVQTFQAWSRLLHEYGLAYFYYSDMFTDYPPMYMYVLWVLGSIRAAFGFEFFSTQANLLFFMPAIIADLITTFLIYHLCRRLLSDYDYLGVPFVIALAYSVNPAVIINSSVWGQVDSIHTLLLFLAIRGVVKKQSLLAYLLYGIAVLTKPQSLIIAPVFLYSAFYYFRVNKYSLKAAATMMGYAVLTFLFMAVLSLPFAPGFDLSPVINQYFATMHSYSFATNNAYNFYALTGGNQRSITFFYYVVTVIAIVGVTGMSFWVLYRTWSEKTAFFAAGLLFTITYVFSIRMHERYLFPALLFFLIAAIYNENERLKNSQQTRHMHKKKFKQKKTQVTTQGNVQENTQSTQMKVGLPLLYVAFSATLFINCVDILLQFHGIRIFAFAETSRAAFMPINEAVALISFINVVLAIYTLKLCRIYTEKTHT